MNETPSDQRAESASSEPVRDGQGSVGAGASAGSAPISASAFVTLGFLAGALAMGLWIWCVGWIGGQTQLMGSVGDALSNMPEEFTYLFVAASLTSVLSLLLLALGAGRLVSAIERRLSSNR